MSDLNPRLLVSGLGFLEGPLFLDDGRLMVTDVAWGLVHCIEPDGAVSEFARVPAGPSGLAVGPDGRVYVTSGVPLSFTKDEKGWNAPARPGTPPPNPGTPGIYVLDADGAVELVAHSSGEHPLVSPNDLVFDSAGGFYFTDHGHHHGRITELGGLYYVPSGTTEVRELVQDARVNQPLTGPNGLSLSLDERKIYVAETPTGRVWEWDVTGPGVIASPATTTGGTSAKLVRGQAGYHLFDSMAVDSGGHLVVATLKRGGLTVISPDGADEEFIEIPGDDPRVTNVCFGGADLRTAYVTTAGSGSVWQLDWPRPGVRLPFADLFRPTRKVQP